MGGLRLPLRTVPRTDSGTLTRRGARSSGDPRPAIVSRTHARAPTSDRERRSARGATVAALARRRASGSPCARRAATARRSRRSPTTRSSRTATPARSSRPTARSSGCACRASTAPSVFGALLDRSAGSFRLAPLRRRRAGRAPLRAGHERARDDLDDTDRLARGARRADDRRLARQRAGGRAYAPADRPRRRPPAGPHRRVRAGRGPARAGLRAALRLRPRRRATGRASAEAADYVLDASDGETTLRLFSDMRMGIEGHTRARAAHMREGEQRFCALSWTERARRPAHRSSEANEHISRTCHYWREWLAAGSYPDHPWREYLQRSALVLKGLTYAPTGAMIAALTTSLPETPGGERNWDYRYCWMRDATFTLWGLHALDLDWEANDFMEYLADLDAQQGRLAADHVRDRRRAEPEGDDAPPPQGLSRVAAGAQGQRRLQPAPERRLRRGARLRLPAHQAPRPHPRPPVAGALRPGRRAPGGSGASPTRGSGRRAASRSTTSPRS